jgi:hypothetical protein
MKNVYFIIHLRHPISRISSVSSLTGTQVLLLVVSETDLVYTFTAAKLQPLVTQPEGKNLIQACLNAPHGTLPSSMPVGQPIGRSQVGPRLAPTIYPAASLSAAAHPVALPRRTKVMSRMTKSLTLAQPTRARSADGALPVLPPVPTHSHRACAPKI